MQVVIRSSGLALVALALSAAAGCGWFASKPADDSMPSEDPAAALPTCRPAAAVAAKHEAPWTPGMTTGGGWQVVSVAYQEVADPAHRPEYVRVSFSKEGVESAVEIAYNSDKPGDWATPSYRLMPAPEQNPPEELLLETIATLREWDAKHADAPFVGKRAGVIDPYEGLPPCAPGEAAN